MPTIGKLVVLKLDGDLEQSGFRVTLEIGYEGDRPLTEVVGALPPAPDLAAYLNRWRHNYRSLGLVDRLEPMEIYYGGLIHPLENCRQSANELRDHFNLWLESPSFRELDKRLREVLSLGEPIRVLIQTQDYHLRCLPWHLWKFIERYGKAEAALSAPEFERVAGTSPTATNRKVRILAILGNSSGIDTEADRKLLEALPNAETLFLVEPVRQQINNHLWEQPWDILFFAGHSKSDQDQGLMDINPHDRLTIDELKYGLRRAIAKGLKLAIFNSCDGLGLAQQLADLQIPQVIVMREPVPDRVAQEFLKYFLDAFARGESLYLAVREARERLQGLEDCFPCATWLPVIFQNPCAVPPTWQNLHNPGGRDANPTQAATRSRNILWFGLAAGLLTASLLAIGLHDPTRLPQEASRLESAIRAEQSTPSIAHAFSGHTQPVWAIAVSSDGHTLASGGEDTAINVWRLDTGQLQHTLTGHSAAIRSLAISPNQQTIASGSGDNMIKLWDVQTGKLRQTLTGHSAPVWSLAITPGGQTLVSGSYDRTIKLWDMQTGKLRQTLTGHTGPVWSVATTLDGKTLASGSSDQTVKLWDLQTGALQQTLTGHSDAVRTVAIGSDNHTLVSGSWDKTIKIWNLHTGELSRTLSDHKDRITTVALNSDHQILASGSVDQTVKLWRVGTWEPLDTLPHSDWVLAVAFSPDAQTLVTSSRDKTLASFNALPE